MKNNWSLGAAGWIVVEDQQVVAARVSLVRSGERTTYKYTHTYTDAYIHKHKYICTYIYTHTQTNICTQNLKVQFENLILNNS